ncbi:MAG: thioredoxin domain-containing protein, partial [Propionibacterium sp.]
RGAEVLQSAEQIAQQLVIEDEVGQRPEIWPLMEKIAKDFDLINGGWGSAPKFPPANLVDALLVKGDKNSLDMAQLTLEAMARGGICDQIGGGFHRYSVDAGWTIPHFEKMLYDNALLLGAYVRTWRRTAEHDEAKRELFKHTIYGIVGWLNRELRTEDGVFASGLDADSCDIRGSIHEGIFYLWNHDLLIDALGVADANWASHTFHVTKTGTFEDGLSTLQLRGRIDYPKLAEISEKLLAERENRFRPATDELVVTAWNGWLIESLVWAAEIFNEPSWLEMATKAAEQLWQTHWDGNRLARTSLHGEPGSGGVLEDYAALANGFAVLAGALGEPNWLERAVQLLEVALELFSADDQGFYDGEPGLFIRYRGLTEAVTPSASATMITALRRVALMANRPDFAVRAEEASQTTMAVLAEHPRFAGAILADQLII